MKSLLRRFERLSLSQKLASLLTATFLLSLLLLVSALNSLFTEYAEKQIDLKSSFLVDSMSSVRDYTDRHIDPILSPINAQSKVFLAEAIPFYSAKRAFSYLKSQPAYAEYSYREAALNPTNLEDKADAHETKLINAFRSNPALTVQTGKRNTSNGLHHFVAKPIRVSDQKCLTCHSTHERAPANLVATYGKANGFGWQLGEVVGAQIISVPVDAIYKAKRESLSLVALINTGAFVATAAVLLLFLSRAIVRPIKSISAHAFEASLHPESVEFAEKQRQDEIGLIAQSFDRMKQSLTIAMRMLKNSADGPA
jgi:HAMP domain-containing protein